MVDARASAATTGSIRMANGARFAQATAAPLGRMFHARRAVFADRSADAPAEARVHFVNWPAWCTSYYCRHVLCRDPIRGWLDSQPGATEPGVARLSDLVPALRSAGSAFPDARLGASGAGHVLTIALREDARVVAALSLVRMAGERDFSDADCELARSIAPVLELAWHGAHAGFVQAPLPMLTPREREVVSLVIAGHGNKSIARLLGASPWTVKNHLRSVFRKTGVSNRTALCALVHAGSRFPI